MHAIVLLTAVTATSGLFGGNRHCKTGNCGAGYARPAVATSSCQTGRCGASYAAPQVYAAPVHAPAPAAYAPAPQAAAPVAAPSYYYPTTATTSCASGTCPRR